MVNPSNGRLADSLQRFSGILPGEDIQALLALQEEPLPTGIRINPLKRHPQQAIRDLSARYGWQADPIPFCKNAWTLHNVEQPPGTTIEHRLGQYYLQDAASMVPVSLFNFDDANPLILDMAASPGGKTTHLVDHTLDKGFIIANDASNSRIPALRAVLASWGTINQVVTSYPGEVIGSWFPETFDGILLDAPCSMENLRPTASRPLRETTRSERLRLQERQVELLESGLAALKVGGQLVYATCSLAPEEDEAVINALLERYPDVFDIVDVADKFSFSAPGLNHYADIDFHPTLGHTLRLWPHLTGMSGFFCALLTKTQSMPTPKASPPQRDFILTGLQPIDPGLGDQVFDQIQDNYGINLRKVLESHQAELYRRYDQLFLMPQRYLSHFARLPFEYIGMPLGIWREDSLEPSHELISRFGHQFTRGILCINDDQVNQWISGRDIRHPDTSLTAQGQFLMVTDSTERNLGMGKLLPKRLRNMLPRQLI